MKPKQYYESIISDNRVYIEKILNERRAVDDEIKLLQIERDKFSREIIRLQQLTNALRGIMELNEK